MVSFIWDRIKNMYHKYIIRKMHVLKILARPISTIFSYNGFQIDFVNIVQITSFLIHGDPYKGMVSGVSLSYGLSASGMMEYTGPDGTTKVCMPKKLYLI